MNIRIQVLRLCVEIVVVSVDNVYISQFPMVMKHFGDAPITISVGRTDQRCSKEVTKKTELQKIEGNKCLFLSFKK